MGNSDNVKNELDKIPAGSIHGKLINFEKTVRLGVLTEKP